MERVDWPAAGEQLDALGHARLPGLLTATECRRLSALWDDRERFRSHVEMGPRRYGEGAYRYFAHPLPPEVERLRASLYPPLARVANRWMQRLGRDVRYPRTLRGFLRRCHAAGQERPTPLLLRYGAGGYNCLHQDLYGEHVFPLQAAVLLSEPGVDFEGGEFVLAEQRLRMQSRVEVVPLRKGDAVVFAVNVRPVQGTRGDYRVKLRHGVGTVRAGRRHALGVIFHDAA